MRASRRRTEGSAAHPTKSWETSGSVVYPSTPLSSPAALPRNSAANDSGLASRWRRTVKSTIETSAVGTRT